MLCFLLIIIFVSEKSMYMIHKIFIDKMKSCTQQFQII